MSFEHMTGMAAEARTKGVAEWITEHVNLRRRYKGARKLRNESFHE